MKKIKEYVFYLNPLFCMYFDVPSATKVHEEERERFELCGFPTVSYKREIECRESNHLEIKQIHYPEAINFWKWFKTYWIKNPLFLNLWLKNNEMVIALITFMLSILISINKKCRQDFCSSFQGKVPAIFQFCLETFWMGPISNFEYISKFCLLEDYYDTISFASLNRSFADWDSVEKFYFDDIYTWFSLLRDHFNSSKQSYMEWVELKPVPLTSEFFKVDEHAPTEKNYFCGLTVQNNQIFATKNSYFQELPKEKKETYNLLAQVLDVQCVLEGKNLRYPHKDLLGPSFDEKKTISKLLNFVVNDCKNYLIKE